MTGTVLLDIISTITDYRHPRDAIGTTTLNFGGVAYNVAVNLRSMGIPVTLMTALNRSPISQMLKNELENNDIRLHLKDEPKLADGIYNGYFLNGSEIASVWSNILESVLFSKPFIKRAMRHASCAIIVNCLSVKSINNCIAVANELGVPVFLSGASLMESHKFQNVTGKIDLIFSNDDEVEQLEKSAHIKKPADIARKMGASLVMTRGDKGVFVYRPDGETINFPINPKNVTKNSLGAGDLFMSATVRSHFFDGLPLIEAIQKSLEIAPKILEREDANIGNRRALETNIASVSMQAEKDKLTGLLNRHGLERFMKNKNLEQKPFHIIMFDVDHFKKFNDTYGHDVGDKVLVEVGKVISKSIRSKDAVGRWGGEEFVCLVDGNKAEVAQGIAERIRQLVPQIKINKVTQAITISAGISAINKSADWQKGLNEADKALYKAKNTGRNRIVLYTDN